MEFTRKLIAKGGTHAMSGSYQFASGSSIAIPTGLAADTPTAESGQIIYATDTSGLMIASGSTFVSVVLS